MKLDIGEKHAVFWSRGLGDLSSELEVKRAARARGRLLYHADPFLSLSMMFGGLLLGGTVLSLCNGDILVSDPAPGNMTAPAAEIDRARSQEFRPESKRV